MKILKVTWAQCKQRLVLFCTNYCKDSIPLAGKFIKPILTDNIFHKQMHKSFTMHKLTSQIPPTQ